MNEILDTLNNYQANKSQHDWERLGKIYQERIHMTKRVINRLAGYHNINVKVKIALARALTFDELREIINENIN